jgi:hypothetical protein
MFAIVGMFFTRHGPASTTLLVNEQQMITTTKTTTEHKQYITQVGCDQRNNDR